MRFVADSMLGKLSKWLRVLGYDTHYQRYYGPGVIAQLVKDNRLLLSRHNETVNRYFDALLIHCDHVGEQLAELEEKANLAPDREHWFSRCLICNVLLEKPVVHKARENVPEHVYFQNMTGIRFCPSCGRYYWPGSHRKRMLRQLEEWGFVGNN
jgi:uncharacterized protein with PIN domain